MITQPIKWGRKPDGTRMPIPGYSGYSGYLADVGGSIWTCWRFKGGGYGRRGSWHQSAVWKQLKPERRLCDGRKRYSLRADDGSRVRHYGSYFVLLAFVGPRPDGMEACHGDGDCTNDAPDNLRWDTPTANKVDMTRHGTRLMGEQINTAKLTEDDVRAIRCLGYPLKRHAERYGITTTMVSLILRRKAWQHVE